MGAIPRLHKIEKYEAMKIPVNTDRVRKITPNLLIQNERRIPNITLGLGFKFVFSLISLNLNALPFLRRSCALPTASCKYQKSEHAHEYQH